MNIYYLKGIKITICNMQSAVDTIIHNAKNRIKCYVCVTDAGNIVNAIKNDHVLKEAINNSSLSLPDGQPLVILMKLLGYKNVNRVTGPDFFKTVIKETRNSNLSHLFIGDTRDTLIKLKNKILSDHNVIIKDIISPPFREFSQEDNKNLLNKINNASADFIWVSLGGGRQEKWIFNNYEFINTGIIVGVGAAFRFYLGDIKRAPKLVQIFALEWLFRLIQQPKKMFLRYMKTLPVFVLYFFQEIFKNKIIQK